MSAEFRQRHMRVIESNENDVSSQIRMNHGRELEVVDAALDQILQGLDAFAYEKQRADSRLEDAQMFLAVRSFNSLHITRQHWNAATTSRRRYWYEWPWRTSLLQKTQKPILQRWTRYSMIKDLSAVET